MRRCVVDREKIDRKIENLILCPPDIRKKIDERIQFRKECYEILCNTKYYGYVIKDFAYITVMYL